MNKIKVSIIIPVYGVEQYIERCARTLFNQTFTDLEYIFVDDCTPDESISILQRIIEEYPKYRKEHIKILHHNENKGLPQARKTGILAAEGDYIINFDSDDWVDTTIIELMYNKAIEDDADIVICDAYLTDGASKLLKKSCYSIKKVELIKDICIRQTWDTWNKLIKRNLFDESTIFPSQNMGEDMALIIPLLLKATKISYLPHPLYYYFDNSNSITKAKGEKISSSRHKMLLQNVGIVIRAFDEAGMSEEYKDIIDILKMAPKRMLLPLVHSKKYFKIWRETYSEINFRILFNRHICLKEKFTYILTYMHLYPRKTYRIPVE